MGGQNRPGHTSGADGQHSQREMQRHADPLVRDGKQQENGTGGQQPGGQARRTEKPAGTQYPGQDRKQQTKHGDNAHAPIQGKDRFTFHGQKKWSAANIKKTPGLAGVIPGVKLEIALCGAQSFLATRFEFVETLSVNACHRGH